MLKDNIISKCAKGLAQATQMQQGKKEIKISSLDNTNFEIAVENRNTLSHTHIHTHREIKQ